MPGRRLTHDDRQHIAAGLAGGLGYAEIARRLGRPTSTVSREVLRNGGPDSYEADSAQQATGRRADRVEPEAGTFGSDEPDAVRAFEEQFAAMMVRTGLPRMPARVLVSLLTAQDGTLSAAELVHRLHVSPASVSKAVAYLEPLQLVRRERGGRDRRERYVIDDDAWYRASAWEVYVCEMWAGAARQGAQVLDGTPAAARLDEMSRFFEHVGRDLAKAAEHWRHVFGGDRVRTADQRMSPSNRDARPAGSVLGCDDHSTPQLVGAHQPPHGEQPAIGGSAGAVDGTHLGCS